MQAKRSILALVAAVAIVLVFAAPAAARETASADGWQVRSITTPVTGGVPSFIATDGNLIAWTGARADGSRMYVFDLVTGRNTPVPHALPGSYYNPCLDGYDLVFQGGRASGYDDIFVYDTRFGTLKQITRNTFDGDWNDWNPRVQGGRVVWEKDMLGVAAAPGIYLYDLATGSTSMVLAGDDYRDPDIWGDYVVCVKNVKKGAGTGPASEILLHNLVTKETRSIADSSMSNEHPRVDAGLVVWSSGQPWAPGVPNPWLTYQVNLYDIATGTTEALTNNIAGNLSPSISGDRIAWETKLPSAVMLYERATGSRMQMPMQSDVARSPQVASFGLTWFGNKGLYTAVPPADATRFPDVPGMYAYWAAIEGMAAKDIISGYVNGTYGPDAPVTRQQFAKMIVLTRGLTATLNDEYYFTDAASIHRKPGELYAYHFVARAAISGLVKGYTDGSFRPLNNISRQQVVTMLVRAGSNVLQQPSRYYNGLLDYSDPTHGENIRVAEFNGLLDGILGSGPGLTGWNTRENATRGECAQMLWNLLGKL